jgi:protein TonB
MPEDVVVPEPEIAMSPGAAGPSIAAGAMGQVMAPRPDPDFRNEPPALPAELGGYARSAVLVLRILVLQDGTVGDAQIVKSSGETTIDAIGVAFVKDAWRFIPASVGGQPVQNWTTVFVRFS